MYAGMTGRNLGHSYIHCSESCYKTKPTDSNECWLWPLKKCIEVGVSKWDLLGWRGRGLRAQSTVDGFSVSKTHRQRWMFNKTSKRGRKTKIFHSNLVTWASVPSRRFKKTFLHAKPSTCWKTKWEYEWKIQKLLAYLIKKTDTLTKI